MENQVDLLLEDPSIRSDVISCLLDVGELLLSNGAGVSRVEDALERLGNAFGFKRCDIHAINSSIILTMTTPCGNIETQARRIHSITTNLYAVEQANDLSRKICSGKADLAMVRERVEEIRKAKVYPPTLIYLGFAIAGSFFTLFFGGSWRDLCAAIPLALLLHFFQRILIRSRANQMVENIILSAILTAGALLGSRLFPFLNADMIIIGNIMLLIPGLAFCNGTRDMIMGDTISGLLTLCDALLRALSIGIGYAAVWVLIWRLL